MIIDPLKIYPGIDTCPQEQMSCAWIVEQIVDLYCAKGTAGFMNTCWSFD